MKEFKITEEQLDILMKASQPVVYINFGAGFPDSPQENVNRAWADLGRELGFDSTTVRQIEGKDNLHFTAKEVE